MKRSEQEVAFDGPAIMSNRFFASSDGQQFRIAFLEQGVGAEAVVAFRTAVSLSRSDAAALGRMLLAAAESPAGSA